MVIQAHNKVKNYVALSFGVVADFAIFANGMKGRSRWSRNGTVVRLFASHQCGLGSIPA